MLPGLGLDYADPAHALARAGDELDNISADRSDSSRSVCPRSGTIAKPRTAGAA